MTAEVERLKKELAALDAVEREVLYHFLAERLPDAALEDEDLGEVEAAWEAELHRRAEEIVSGKAHLIPSAQVIAELRARIS